MKNEKLLQKLFKITEKLLKTKCKSFEPEVCNKCEDIEIMIKSLLTNKKK